MISLSVNAPFLKSIAKVPICKLKRVGKIIPIVVNQFCYATINNGLPINMGDLGQLTLPCEFGNASSIIALADSGASFNLMPYSFYKKFALTNLQNTRMTLRMEDQLITLQQRTVENLLVNDGKFIFSVDFMVLDIKEDEHLLIIIGRQLLSTTISLIDIHDSCS